MAKALSLYGQRFGRLLVIKSSPKRTIPVGEKAASLKSRQYWTRTQWLCRCDCGNEKILSTLNLRSGHTNSCGCLHFLGGDEAAFRLCIENYRRQAQRAKRQFTLTPSQFKEIVKKNCFYCGEPPKQIRKPGGRKNRYTLPFIYNGIDRVINTEGYTIQNCVPCCGICNYMKHYHSQGNFLKKVKQICQYLNL